MYTSVVRVVYVEKIIFDFTNIQQRFDFLINLSVALKVLNTYRSTYTLVICFTKYLFTNQIEHSAFFIVLKTT